MGQYYWVLGALLGIVLTLVKYTEEIIAKAEYSIHNSSTVIISATSYCNRSYLLVRSE